MTGHLDGGAARRLTGIAALVMAVLVAALGVAPAVALEPPPQPVIEEPPPDWPGPGRIDAAAALLVDAGSGQVLVEQGAEQPRPVASTIKVLTALSVLERTDLDDEVTVGEEVAEVPGSGVGLTPGDTWTVEQLIDSLIARSGNEAARALAVHVAGDVAAFAELMEADAAALGIEGLELSSPSGLDDDQQLSARELATIARAALADERLRPFLGRTSVELPGEGELSSRNQLLERYDGATGLKTGFTEAAGNSLLASAQRDGRELVAVVLGADDDPARFDLAAQLLDLGFERYAPLELGGELTFAVAGGEVGVRVEPTEVVAPRDGELSLDWPLAPRPPSSPPRIAIRDDQGADAGALGAVPSRLEDRRGPSPEGDGQRLGRALVDGVYAGLRAGAAGDRLS